jgi:hypothetical protein
LQELRDLSAAKISPTRATVLILRKLTLKEFS